MQSLTSLLGGSGRYSQFMKFTGSGLWVPPSGVQMAHVAMVGGGGGGGTYGVNGLSNGSYISGGGTIYSGGGGGYLEFDYPILGRASIAYSVGVGGAGAASAVASGNTTGSASSTANASDNTNFDTVWPVPSSMVTAMQAAGVPVVLQLSGAALTGASTITFNASPAALGVAVGWSVGTSYRGGLVGTIASISGNTITLVGTLGAALGGTTKLCMYSNAAIPYWQIYIPSTSYVTSVAILSATSVISLNLNAATPAASLVSGLSVIASSVDLTGDNGTATTFGEYSAGGGFGTGAGGQNVVPGLVTPALSSTSNFPFQTSGAVISGAAGSSSIYSQATSAGGRSGGIMAAAYGVGPAGVNGSDGGPGCGGAFCPITNSATPPPVGGKGGDGLLVLLY